MISDDRMGLVARPVIVITNVALFTWLSPPWVDAMSMNFRSVASPAQYPSRMVIMSWGGLTT